MPFSLRLVIYLKQNFSFSYRFLFLISLNAFLRFGGAGVLCRRCRAVTCLAYLRFLRYRLVVRERYLRAFHALGASKQALTGAISVKERRTPGAGPCEQARMAPQATHSPRVECTQRRVSEITGGVPQIRRLARPAVRLCDCERD